MSLSRRFDRIAIALSTICIVHCLFVPLIIAALPVAAIGIGSGAHGHALLLWVVVPTGLLGLGLGFRLHRRTDVVVVGAVSIVVLMVAGTHGHHEWPMWVEASVSVVASLALAGAHWVNYREVRRVHRHHG